MTLMPEPREVRTLRRPGAPRGGTQDERLSLESREIRLELDTTSYIEQVKADFAAISEASARVAQVFEDYRTLFLAFLPRSARRRIRKKVKLVAHHQAKLDRIPTWKRS